MRSRDAWWFVLIFALRATSALPQLTAAPSGLPLLHVTTYNVHSCRGLDLRYDCDRIARVLLASRADVVALQEVRAAQADQIARDLGFHVVFAPADIHNGYTFGNAILTRFQIRESHLYRIGVPGRQQRACLRADIAWPDQARLIHVFTTHLGLKREERETQTLRLVSPEIMGSPDLLHAPVILMGDFNEKQSSGFANRHLSAILQAVVKPSWPGFLPILSLDHLYCNRAWKVRSARVGSSAASLIASDHGPLVATLEEESTIPP